MSLIGMATTSPKKKTRNPKEYQDHTKRLGTMLSNYAPQVIRNMAYALAFMGFFYTGPPGSCAVKCVGCDTEVEVDEDSPAEEIERRHKNCCQSCPFVSGEGRHTLSLQPMRFGPLHGPSQSYREYNSLSNGLRKSSLTEQVCAERTIDLMDEPILKPPTTAPSADKADSLQKQAYHNDDDDEDDMYYSGYSEHHHTWGPDSEQAVKHRKLCLKTPSAFPFMEHKHSRFVTFSAKCPVEMFHQDFDTLAGAGFFYSGTPGRLTCFHCSVSIEGWTEFDMPWAEHARHSPDCEFVLSMRGQYFVQISLGVQPRTKKVEKSAEAPLNITPEVIYPPHVGARGLDLFERPSIDMKRELEESYQRQVNRGIDEHIHHHFNTHVNLPSILEELSTGRLNGKNASSSEVNSRSARPKSTPKSGVEAAIKEFQIDPREVRMRMDTDRVLEALRRGHDRRLVARVIETRLRKYGDDHNSLTELMQDIFKAENDPSFLLPEMTENRSKSKPISKEETMRRLAPEAQTSNVQMSSTGNSNLAENNSKSTSNTNATLKNGHHKDTDSNNGDLSCKICMSERASVVFIPCGHLMSCSDCASSLKQCPMCRRKIVKLQKVFIS